MNMASLSSFSRPEQRKLVPLPAFTSSTCSKVYPDHLVRAGNASIENGVEAIALSSSPSSEPAGDNWIRFMNFRRPHHGSDYAREGVSFRSLTA